MVLHLTWVLGIKKNGFWGQEKTTHITLGLWHYLKPEYLKATKINSCQVIGDKHVYHLKRWLTIRCCILQYPPLPRQQCDEELSFPPSISWLTCATIGWLERWLTSECRAICLRIDWATGRDWADRLGPGRVSCGYTHSHIPALASSLSLSLTLSDFSLSLSSCFVSSPFFSCFFSFLFHCSFHTQQEKHIWQTVTSQ